MERNKFLKLSYAALAVCITGFLIHRTGVSENGWYVEYAGMTFAFGVLVTDGIARRKNKALSS